MADLDAQRRALTDTLDALKSAQVTQGETLATNTRALADLQKGIQAVQEAQVASNRAAGDRASDGSDRHLARYRAGSDADVKRNRACYLATDDGKVRLRGHTVRGGQGYRFGLLDDPNPRNEWQREFQRLVTDRSICRVALANPSTRAAGETPLHDELIAEHIACAPDRERRIFANSSAIGTEWIPNNLTPELERELGYVSGFHKVFPETQFGPSGTMILPYIEDGGLRVYGHAVPTANDPAEDVLSDLVTRQNALTAQSMVCATQLHRDAEEDSLVPALPQITADIAAAFSRARDDIAINGDTTATHQDAIASWDIRGVLGGTSGLGTSLDHRRLGMGLRARSFDISTTLDMSTETEVKFRQLLLTLGGAYYSQMHSGRIKVAVSPEVFIAKMLGWAEFQTWDAVGPAAAILTGFLGSRGMSPGSVGMLWGTVEVILTPFLSADLAATGLYTGSGALSGCLAFDAGDFERRVRRGDQLETAVDIRNNTRTIVVRSRELWRTKANDTSGNKANVAFGYNMDITAA